MPFFRRTLVGLALAASSASAAFVPPTDVVRPAAAAGVVSSSTRMYFGIPTFGAKDESRGDDDDSAKGGGGGGGGDGQPEKKIGMSGLVQLITAGMGSPFLGDFEGVEEETGKLMFSLEANNLVDEDGQSKQTKAPYFESGWVSEEDMEKERQKKEKGGGFKFW